MMKFTNPLKDKFRSIDLYDQLDTQLYTQLEAQLHTQLDTQLYTQLEAQLHTQLDTQLYNELYKSTQN